MGDPERPLSLVEDLQMKLEDKLYLLKFKPDEKTHLQPKIEDCANCEEKPCTLFCPAGVYKWEEGKWWFPSRIAWNAAPVELAASSPPWNGGIRGEATGYHSDMAEKRDGREMG